MLISSAEIFGVYVPNILAAVKGESTVYEKIKPYLIESEYWLKTNIVDGDVIEGLDANSSVVDELYRIICLDAFYNAIPSLDLVLTPNGFGVVSNQNVAPASKERVANLRESLIKNRDLAIVTALSELHEVEAWRTSLLGKKFGMLLVQNISITQYLTEDGAPSWECWQKTIIKFRNLQQKYEKRVIGSGLMQSLCSNILDSSITDVEMVLAQMVIDNIIEWCKDPLRIEPHSFENIVQYIRENTDTFTAWGSSDVAKQWEDNSFENDKKAGGYWL